MINRVYSNFLGNNLNDNIKVAMPINLMYKWNPDKQLTSS